MIINDKPITYLTIYHAVIKKERIYIAPEQMKNLAIQRKLIEKSLIKDKDPIYGINTGFGALKNVKISFKDISQLQQNLINSHAVGVGSPFPAELVRAMMIIQLIYLSKNHSGIRPEVLMKMIDLLDNNIIPVVPEKGSVGASGDLAPSSHIALVLTGEGEVWYENKIIPAESALKAVGIVPIKLEAKEGLALINNTAAMCAASVFAMARAHYLSDIANVAGALSAQSLLATHDAFDERIHKLKSHKGQIFVAERMRKLLAGSSMIDKKRIQDQYSIRCIPQVHGAIRDAVNYAEGVVNTELNSVTDNPLFFTQGGKIEIISGGNFHGEAISLAMDTLRIAVSELANIADRRIFSLLDPALNFGLPAFLAMNPGINSGLMVLQYTTASLVSENKILSHPAAVDSIPTSANVEDHVSMGTISARKTLEVLENVTYVLAIELIVACQALDFRLKAGKQLSKETLKVYKKIRSEVPFFEMDQQYGQSIKKIVNMLVEMEI